MPANTPTLLAICGSLRAESLNRKAMLVVARAAEREGATLDIAAPLDLDLPLYNQDDEDKHGVPEPAIALRQRMKAANGLIVACPEFNGTMTAALKNAIDWASRQLQGEAPLECFRGKTAGLIAASPGKLGGIRGLPDTRRVLSSIGVHVIANDFALGSAHEAFDADGNPTTDACRNGLEVVGTTLARFTRALMDA